MIELVISLTLAVGVPVYEAPHLEPLGRYRDQPARILLQPRIVRMIRQGNPCAVLVLAHELGHHWRGRTNEPGANEWARTYFDTIARRLHVAARWTDVRGCRWTRSGNGPWHFG